VKKGLLRFHSTRPTMHGIEMHLVRMHKEIERFDPRVVVVDPISNLQSAGVLLDSTNMLIRLIDLLRKRNILGFFVSLTRVAGSSEGTDEGMSSLVDTWLLLRDIEAGGERNRILYVLKSRGMAHSNQVREFLITSRGVRLVPAYLGPGGVLTGSARVSQEAREREEQSVAHNELERRRLDLESRRRALAAQLEALQGAFASEEKEFQRLETAHRRRETEIESDRMVLARRRSAGAKGAR
jgi:circadian clock protein KaiC